VGSRAGNPARKIEKADPQVGFFLYGLPYLVVVVLVVLVEVEPAGGV
jgi:hypothetical protein